MNQDYQNHKRFHPLFHYILSLLIFITIVGAICFVVRSGISLPSILTLAIVIILAIMFVLIRQYPLKAQDRAIRAEENLRHYVLTGKLLDTRLTVGQIIALRFADDAEFPALTEKAVSQNLSPDDIKKQITNWRADYFRI